MNRILPGLVSITFRQLAAREVVAAASAAGLAGIEWGGDVHVPHGDLKLAAEVRRITEDAGLVIPSYGSYYRAGVSEQDGLSFSSVLDSAIHLGAPLVRVWAGRRGSGDADAEYRSAVRDDCRRISDMAAEAGIAVASEYHGGTLTDTDASAVEFLAEVEHSNFKTYWQPRNGVTPGEGSESLQRVLPMLAHIHVFQWTAGGERLPLAQGADHWSRYLEVAASAAGERFALLEFVQDNDPAILSAEANSLKELIRECSGYGALQDQSTSSL